MTSAPVLCLGTLCLSEAAWPAWFSAMGTLFVGVVVVALTHRLTEHRDVSAEQRSQRVGYLVTAFRVLANASHADLPSIRKEVEQAVSDIQLFGSAQQIELVHAFCDSFAEQAEQPTFAVELDPLLASLRDSLRRELHEEPATGPIYWLRIGAPRENLAFATALRK